MIPDEATLIEFVNLCNQYPNEAKTTLWERAAGEFLGLPKVQNRMEATAQAVATLSPDKWAGWVIYLLEALQEHATRDDYRGVLLNVVGDIEGWLKVGRW